MDTFNKQSLGFFPTPFHRLPSLQSLLGGPELFIKRDDQTGLALGGNKTRKLEYILGDAVSKGADTIITAGAAQSNHCRQTAAAAARLGLECHLVLGGESPSLPGGNLLLDHIFGCQIHWAGDRRKGEDIPLIFEQLKHEGKKPYVVPYGGSNIYGVLSFIEASRELHKQLEAVNESITHIVFASSSGGTHAGLMLGKHLLRADYQLIGINIDKDEIAGMSLHEYILNLTHEAADVLNVPHKFSDEDVILDSNYTGDGYGVIGDLEREAIALIARRESVLLDPVYTGRAMGALINMIRKGVFKKTDKVLFLAYRGYACAF